MAEYIDREAFKKSIEERYCLPCKAEGKDYNGCRCRACWVDAMLDEVDCFQTAADVAPIVHGRWELEYETYGKMRCSVCKKEALIEKAIGDVGVTTNYVDSNYCPNCGAKMDGGIGNG